MRTHFWNPNGGHQSGNLSLLPDRLRLKEFAPLLDASKSQLLAVQNAFSEAVAQVELALQDPQAPMPSVPVWADEVRAIRGVSDIAPKANKTKLDPQVKEKANQTVQKVLAQLEAELALGHGKATVLAANALRNALKDFAHQIDHKLEGRLAVHLSQRVLFVSFLLNATGSTSPPSTLPSTRKRPGESLLLCGHVPCFVCACRPGSCFVWRFKYAATRPAKRATRATTRRHSTPTPTSMYANNPSNE